MELENFENIIELYNKICYIEEFMNEIYEYNEGKEPKLGNFYVNREVRFLIDLLGGDTVYEAMYQRWNELKKQFKKL